MKVYSLLLPVLFLLFTSPLFAEDRVEIDQGFVKGEYYLKMNIMGRTGYAMGIIDGMLISPIFGGSKDKVLWLGKCVEHMTNQQVEAIITKYLENHPGLWHHPLNVEAYNAMLEACK